MKKTMLLILSVISFTVSAQKSDTTAFLLKSGTMVQVSLIQSLSSKTKGSASGFVINDVVDYKTGKMFIANGTTVELNIISVAAKATGKPGSLSINAIRTTSVDGQSISLSGNLSDTGEDRKTLANVLAWGGCLIISPLSLFFLFIKGEEAEMPASTLLNAKTTQNYFIGQ